MDAPTNGLGRRTSTSRPRWKRFHGCASTGGRRSRLSAGEAAAAEGCTEWLDRCVSRAALRPADARRTDLDARTPAQGVPPADPDSQTSTRPPRPRDPGAGAGAGTQTGAQRRRHHARNRSSARARRARPGPARLQFAACTPAGRSPTRIARPRRNYRTRPHSALGPRRTAGPRSEISDAFLRQPLGDTPQRGTFSDTGFAPAGER